MSTTVRGDVLILCAVLAVAAMCVLISVKESYSNKRDKNDDVSSHLNAEGLPDSTCEVIHISVVCLGYNDSREVSNLVKTVLFHRNNPLHFHFISDQIARHILETLFETWDLSGVETTFYSVERLKEEEKSMQICNNSDPLPTLHLTELLPDTLEKVIALNAKVILTSDIVELWQQFDVMTDTKAIAIVVNGTRYYKMTRTIYNTGVMLLNLKKLRDIKWVKTLQESCVEITKHTNNNGIQLEQEVITSAISKESNVVYVLPCTWNLQIDESTTDKYCMDEMRDLSAVKVIQWRLPIQCRWFPEVEYFEYVRHMYSALLDLNGNFLRRKAYRCAKFREDTEEQELDENETCYKYRSQKLLKYRTHLYLLPFQYSPKPDGYDVTLITQLSVDRLRMLEPLSTHWKGPMSIAVYMTDSEAHTFVKYVMDSSILKNRQNIAYHMVYKNGPLYPANHLRNVAAEEAVTPYVFCSDIDCLPKHNLYQYTRASLSALSNPSTSLQAFIIPAFETFARNLFDDAFPKSKAELLSLLETQQVYPFKINYWEKDQNTTDFPRWTKATSPYKVTYQKEFQPFVVVKKEYSRYDTRFLGIIGDRWTYTLKLHVQGFKFIVLPDAFIIHMPHYPCPDLYKFRQDYLFQICTHLFTDEFENDLIQTYGGLYL